MRTRGEGGLVKRGHLWHISYDGPEGCFRESARTTSKTVALSKLQKRIAALRAGDISLGRVTVADLMADVFQDYRLNKKRSLEDAEARWRNNLEPVFGTRRAITVTRKMLADYAEARRAKGAKNGTINRELSLLRRAYSLRDARLPKFRLSERDNVRKGFITEAEADRLALECTKHGLWFRALFALLFEFGLRVGEALSLRVYQIDLATRTVHLNPGETKSGEGREAVMTSATALLLESMCVGKKPDAFVFTRDDDSRIKDFRGAWEAATKAAGLNLLVHDLRRSAIRRMIQRGIPQHVAMQISGHKTDEVFRRYAIIDHADLRAAAEKLEPRCTIDAQRPSALEPASGNMMN